MLLTLGLTSLIANADALKSGLKNKPSLMNKLAQVAAG